MKTDISDFEGLSVGEVKVAFVRNGLDKTVIDVLDCDQATMYDSEGSGQYCLENLIEQFEEDSIAFKQLNWLLEQGYDYLEY